MIKKSYTAIILAAAMVAASPAAVFAQETTDTQVTSAAIAAEDVSEPSLSEQPWLPAMPAAPQAQEYKLVSFAGSETVDQDGVLSRTVADEENGLYVITYGDEEHPVLDADNNEITDEYVNTLLQDLKNTGAALQNDQTDQIDQAIQLDQEAAETVLETFEIDYVVNGEETPLDAPRYVVLKIDGLLATDPVTILHQGEIDGKAEWAPLEIVARGDGLVCARFDSFSPTVVLSTQEVALTASAATENSSSSNNTAGQNSTNGTTGGSNTGTDSTAANTSADSGNTGNAGNNAKNNAGTTQNAAGTETTNNHVHNLTFVPAVAATSTQDGNIAYYKCDECGKLFTDENGINEVTSVVDHNWGQWIVTKSPTSTEAGIQERTCSVCGEKESKEIPAGTDMTTYNPNPTTNNTGNGLTALNSANAANTDGKVSPPKTGDSASMPALYVAMAAAAAMLLSMGLNRKRRDDEESGKA